MIFFSFAILAYEIIDLEYNKFAYAVVLLPLLQFAISVFVYINKHIKNGLMSFQTLIIINFINSTVCVHLFVFYYDGNYIGEIKWSNTEKFELSQTI